MRSLKPIQFLLGLCYTLFVWSCNSDNWNEGGMQVKNKLTLTLSVDGMDTGSATRAAVPSEDGETTVNSLYLFFFEASDDQTGLLKECVDVSSAGGVLNIAQSYLLSSATTVNAADAYNILAVANIDNYAGSDVSDWLATFEENTEAFFRENALAYITGLNNDTEYDTNNRIFSDQLLMYGYTVKAEGQKSIQMSLQRALSRFDIINSIADGDYEIVSASIWNAYTVISVSDDDVFDYSPESVNRTKRFYGITNDPAVNNDIKGGLYVFRNYSEAPIQNDKSTTCVIVGLESSSGVRYYRINVAASGKAQNLKRNNAYRTTILSVNGDGYASETEAYVGTTNQLTYAVNLWNLDDNGLIVTDEYSLLAVPVKTVKIGMTGGEFSYTITTFSTLTDPSPLAIKTQLWEPDGGNIYAQIRDGQLVIIASEMILNEQQRSGIITVAYAGLETTVNVIQSAEAGKYLYVTVEDEWDDQLPPTPNGMSEFVNVTASGPWTAKIYGSDNFAFMLGGYYSNVITSSDVQNSRFHIYTQLANDSQTETQKGFALITLDEDPENYIAVVTVYQSSKGGIQVEDDWSTLPFFGSKYIKDASTPGALSNIEDYTFSISSGATISPNTVRITGQHADRFTLTYTDNGSGTGGTIVVKAAGANSSGSAYNATLVAADNKNGYMSISLTQDPIVINPTITGSTTVGKTGGTLAVNVSCDDPYVQWTVNGSTESDTDGKTLYNHNLSFTGVTPGVPSRTENVTVNIPKVYYPNRNIDIKGRVSVTANIGGASASTEFTQAMLTARTLKIWSRWSNGNVYTYGSLGNYSYFDGFINRLSAKITGGLSSVLTMTASAAGETDPTSDHVWVQMSNSNTGSINWGPINTWYNSSANDGIAVFMMGENNSQFSNASPYSSGYTHGGISRPGGNVRLNSAVNSTRVYDFIINRGNQTINNPNQLTFDNDGVNTYLNSYPSGAVPILNYAGGGYCMIIDLRNKLVYMGDETMFRESSLNNTAGGHANVNDRSAFINNLIDYMLLAAQYGSHFTDLLRDDLASTLPAPWDSSWGSMAWPN